MSRSVDLFIDSSLPLEALADLIRTELGSPLVPGSEKGQYLRLEGGELVELFEHPYVDDEELALSNYRYSLSGVLGLGVGPLDSAIVTGLRRMAQVIGGPTGYPVILVLDLQQRLEPLPQPDQTDRPTGSLTTAGSVSDGNNGELTDGSRR